MVLLRKSRKISEDKMLNRKLLLVVFVIFLIGCQQYGEEQADTIEISGGEPIIEEIDEEFDDNLDDALKELEEIESI